MTAFDADWSFDIGEHRILEEEVVVVGRLTAQGITKCQFGKSKITRNKTDRSIVSLGDDLKAAATDSLKKCATLFGVGLHLYLNEPEAHADHAFAEARNTSGHGGNGRHVNGGYRGNGQEYDDSAGRTNNGADNGRLTAKQLSAIFSLARQHQWSNKDVREFTHEMFGKMPDFLSRKEASAVISHLQGLQHA
jgi:hypothetical protein